MGVIVNNNSSIAQKRSKRKRQKHAASDVSMSNNVETETCSIVLNSDNSGINSSISSGLNHIKADCISGYDRLKNELENVNSHLCYLEEQCDKQKRVNKQLAHSINNLCKTGIALLFGI